MREDNFLLRPSYTNIAVAATIAVAVVLSTVLFSHAFVRARNTDEVIRVIGSARKPIRSDLIIWNGQVTAESANVSQAYTKLESDVAKVRAFLIKGGIPASEIELMQVVTKTLYAPSSKPGEEGYYDESGSASTYRPVVGYQLSQEIEVRSTNVDLVGRVARQSTQIISQGISFESEMPMYLYTKLSQLKVTMQAEAARDARARAEQIAASSKCRIGNLRFARMNVPQITPLYSSSEFDQGVDDTTSLDKKITAIVVAGYAVE